MKQRILQILAATLLTVAVFWAAKNGRKSTSDDAKYRQWQLSIYPYQRVVFLERHLPTRLCEVLRLPALEQRYLHKDEKISATLLASGYLTRVHLAVTNGEAGIAEIHDRICKASKGSSAKWELGLSGSSLGVLTCRPQDVPVITRGMEVN